MGVGAAAAATAGNHTESASLLKVCSIFTEKTHATHLALSTVKASSKKKISIFIDSTCCLQALEKRIPTNPKMRRLEHPIDDIQKSE